MQYLRTSMRILLIWIPLCRFGWTDRKKVCFSKYGCFANTKPFRGKHATLPSHPSVIQTKFYLFTRCKSQSAQLLNVNDPRSITSSTFNSMHKTIIIIHGFTQHAHWPWVIKLKNELLKRDSYNIVNVDWRKAAAFFTTFYYKAVANSRLVGAQLAYLVEILNNTNGASPQSIHIVGYSLGAHIAGYAGRRLARKNLTLGRITGLDPAQLSFEGTHEATRLDKTDAKFVDVIHTDAAPFLRGGMGYRGHLGDVDFYPNGGEYQPGCENILSKIFQKGFIPAVGCNHMRAVEYFIMSIGNTCRFFAFHCTSWEAFEEGRCFDGDVSLMGYDADRFINFGGAMYLKTVSVSPFCGYNYIITISFSKSRRKYNDIYIKLIGTHGETEKENLRVYEGTGEKRKLVISEQDIGTLTSVRLIYYGFSSLYIRKVLVNVLHKNKIYTACFRQSFENNIWWFWQLPESKYEMRVVVGGMCAIYAY